MDVHQVIGERLSTHEADISDGGNGSDAAEKAHKSAIVSGLSGCNDMSNWRADSAACADSFFPL